MALEPLYGAREARSIAFMVMEALYGVGRADIAVYPARELQIIPAHEALLQRLYSGEPVQYVLGKVLFCGLEFSVDSSVLIPRPETEELVEWIVSDWAEQPDTAILDIGTGSGCIAVSLAKKLPGSDVAAIDVSTAALETARRNADLNGTKVDFVMQDALAAVDTWDSQLIGRTYDVIVSNPPYIPVDDKSSLAAHVVGHEPHLALFPDDGDPLVFYRAIARAGKTLLRSGGMLYFEIYSDFAQAVCRIAESEGFTDVVVREDINSKPRMARCAKP